MRSRYQFDKEKGLYFITASTVKFIPLFTSARYCQIITEALQYARDEKDVKIIAFVIMDNHVHVLLEGEDLSNKIKALKGFTAHEIIKQLDNEKTNWLLKEFKFYKKAYKIKSHYQIWQEGVHPQLMQTIEMVLQKIEYIHYNPVKRGLVRKPEDWLYSSASNYVYDEGIIEIDRFDEFQ